MAVFEAYIIGMLTTQKALPLGRIHNMLKMARPPAPPAPPARGIPAFVKDCLPREEFRNA